MSNKVTQAELPRRAFAGLVGTGALAVAGILAGCAGNPQAQGGDEPGAEAHNALPELPPPDPDPTDAFQIDRAINMQTIDAWLGRPDVAYRDLRMFRDPAYYEEIGGSATLDFTLQGFKVVPFPYIGTLQKLPVTGAYTGPTLFDIVWDESGEIVSATANYEQSALIVEELFPRNKPIFLMCGGAGYANMMRRLLLYLGWDPNLVYNVGGAWGYTGYNLVALTHAREDGSVAFYNWRADTVLIEFDQYTPVA